MSTCASHPVVQNGKADPLAALDPFAEAAEAELFAQFPDAILPKEWETKDLVGQSRKADLFADLFDKPSIPVLGLDVVPGGSRGISDNFSSIFRVPAAQSAESLALNAFLGSAPAFRRASEVGLSGPDGNGTSNNGSVTAGPCAWSSYGEGSVIDDTVSMGVADRLIDGRQPVGRHGASLCLDPAAEYVITITYDLSTWDAYNDIGAGGRGFYDSFSVSVTSAPFPQLTWSDPLSLPAGSFLWGGTQAGERTLETYNGTQTLVIPGDPLGDNYLNVVLDTQTSPQVNVLYPSWGMITAQVIAVTGTEWEGYDPGDGATNYYEGGNPVNRGGGDIIYAERNQPQGRQGDQLHDKIRIRARLSAAPPAGQNITVYFRVLDPDHYSADAAFDPNGATAPEDNIRDGGAITTPGARLRRADFTADASSAVLTGDGVTNAVTIGLEITARQPSNNFKVVAHTQQAYVNNVVFAADGVGLREGAAGGPVVPARFQTALLTVWRTLYIERDSMAAPDYTRGLAPSRILEGQITAITEDLRTLTTNWTIYGPGGTNQFQAGRIELLDNMAASLGIFAVASNTTGANSTVTLTAALPADVAPRVWSFRNLEDDDIAGGVTMEITDDLLSWWRSRYDPACVWVDLTKTDLSPTSTQSVNSTAVIFTTNVGVTTAEADEREAIRNIIIANKQARGTQDFWVIYQLGAFQGRVDLDYDPHMGAETPTLGITPNPFRDEEAGTLLYMETIRDTHRNSPGVRITLPNLRRATSVHESAHAFNLSDGIADGPIMDAASMIRADTEPLLNALVFSGAGLRKIIRKFSPGAFPP